MKYTIWSLRIIVVTALLFSCIVMDGSAEKNSVPVLVYHAVDDCISGKESLFVSPEEFRQQMEYLHNQNFTTLTFGNIHEYDKYKKPILITFDDGYKDIYQYAYPVLKKLNLRATMFLITQLIDCPGYLSQKEITEMSDVFSFESHTLNHPKLDEISSEEAETELKMSREAIERITRRPVTALSFPFGRYNGNVLTIAQKYYKYSVTTNYGNYSNGDNRYKINRIYISRSDTLNAFKGKIQKGCIRS